MPKYTPHNLNAPYLLTDWNTGRLVTTAKTLEEAKKKQAKSTKRLDIKVNTQKNPGKILTPGKWIKARAIRVHRGKLEILK